ncbi:MAG TPA: hypothetical protein VK118_07765 [Tetragenococcus sp.]|nr:hypothetical protein [Tetragenococcus sp.]
MKFYKRWQRIMLLVGLLTLVFIFWEFWAGRVEAQTTMTKFVECLAGIALIYVPEFLDKLFKVKIADFIVYSYWLFLFLAVFLGTCFHFMTLVPLWDKLLHLLSPMILTMVGYGILAEFLHKQKLREISPWAFLLFGFAFASVCGIFWEFWEWIWDELADMNLQRYRLGSVQLVGHTALQDTMGYLLVNLSGTLFYSFYAATKSRKSSEFFLKYRIYFLRQ